MDLNKLHEWSKKWLIKFNTKKCKVMHLTKKCSTLKVNYCLGDTQLEETDCEKYLGVLISNDLNWAKHVQSIVSHSYQKLGMISHIFYHCSPDIKEKLYNHLVRSKLEYCCTVWDPNQICLIRSIERIQKKASKLY